MTRDSGKERSGGGSPMVSLETFLDELDDRIARGHRRRLGLERKLVSWTRLENGQWSARLSSSKFPRLRFVRRGRTRVRAIENSDKALADLLKLLVGRGRSLPASGSRSR